MIAIHLKTGQTDEFLSVLKHKTEEVTLIF